eukprot:NODE_108_length_19701_cov_0.369452.p1 type:complete len:1047 gc:universal NODE_108_length_19701_cov_0.369452:15853-18993(+)
MLRCHWKNKILVLGSGGISIGQAGEFDYSGSQAIKALKQDGHSTVLINANIASIQSQLCDQVYYLPVNKSYVLKVIEKERPDGILLSVGGQSAMNVGIELHDDNVFSKYNIKVLGTPISSIKTAEDRDLFSKALQDINIPVAHSIASTSVAGAISAANEISYPVIVRSAFSLGGLGSGFVNNDQELRELATKSLTTSKQLLIEKSMVGWKEVEYEVMRDVNDNTICICNMENFDPLGVHTGDSIVVCPSQTLNDKEYQMLRQASIDIVRKVGVVGECNVQFALNPKKYEFKVIEMNPRLSRSSALASKATGYPLAYLSTKLAMGHLLTDLKNQVTRTTSAGFEPSLDYVVVKFPKFDLSKFPKAVRTIGSQMKAIGEIMAIGRTFEETFQKGLRCLGYKGFEVHDISAAIHEQLKVNKKNYWRSILNTPTDERVLAIANAFHHGLSCEEIHEYSKIDLFFLYKLENIYEMALKLESPLNTDDLLNAKKLGFSDEQIANYQGNTPSVIREARIKSKITPFVKRIDTLANEFPSENNYLYMTYNASSHDVQFNDHGVIVLGSGVYRIGSSCEFDWCTTNALRSLRDLNHKTISINNNPETVSTDYDESDKLYFEELTVERIMDIYELEQSKGIIVSVGGQIPQNICMELDKNKCKILGTLPEQINKAESRDLFSGILDRLGIKQPSWHSITNEKDAIKFSHNKYPVLVRPSFVLSGSSFKICNSDRDLLEYLKTVDYRSGVVISEYLEDSKEIDFDGVAQHGKLACWAISEHIEQAGVHSGDASLILPNTLSDGVNREIGNIARKIAMELQISGPFNMQIILKDKQLFVIECNVRASRSFPYVSKTVGLDFIKVAISAIMDESEVGEVRKNSIKAYCVKVPQFSWNRLTGADVLLGVEMQSTGEVAAYSDTIIDAFKVAMESTIYYNKPKKGIFIGQDSSKDFLNLLKSAELCSAYLPLYSIDEVLVDELVRNSINCTLISKNDLINKTDLCLYFGGESKGYEIRRLFIDMGIAVISNAQISYKVAQTLSKETLDIKSWQEWTGFKRM